MRYSSSEERAKASKAWPLERFREVAHFVRREYPGMNIVVVGMESERELVTGAFGRDGSLAVNLCGRTRIRDLLQLLRHARLLVCLESGVMHLASVVDCPVISLWGPSNEAQTAPFGLAEKATLLRAVPLEEARRCTDSMERISTESVCSEIRRRIGSVP